MDKIILASNNQGKIKEFNLLLKGVFAVVSMQDLQVSEVAETGLSFVENAIIKARNAAKQSDLPALADDSGLVVEALNGAPGIFSARYSGANSDDKANVEKLLKNMQNKTNRKAQFWCAIVLVKSADDPVPLVIQRGWQGEILSKKTGENGFGYDPIFYLPSHNCSAAELDLKEKNKISHRGKALQALLQKLQC
ncbi:MAG: RdgB/HAM1 family non-canonical purine NTP pyrophosphatase [Betaproteobacteria bacterium]|nr:RdgB/HAM1 family non-canonical purine NTP pyrophosphatase [Betaproteobacteria bacterium]